MTTHALEEGYLRLLHAGPEWGESVLTNHGPMAVEILARRGHEDEIEPWLDDYLPRLSDLPLATSTIDPKEWREALGEGARVADWTEFFSRELKQMPWRDVLETWWPRLLPGMVAGTTHGVIRVSHAVRVLLSGQSDPTTLAELGHGLAFWAARFRGVPEPQDAEGSLQPGPAIDVLPRIPHQTGTVANRFGQLAALPEWSRGQANLARIETAEDAERLLTGLTDAATFRYVKHGHASPVLLVTPRLRRMQSCIAFQPSPRSCGLRVRARPGASPRPSSPALPRRQDRRHRHQRSKRPPKLILMRWHQRRWPRPSITVTSTSSSSPTPHSRCTTALATRPQCRQRGTWPS